MRNKSKVCIRTSIPFETKLALKQLAKERGLTLPRLMREIVAQDILA